MNDDIANLPIRDIHLPASISWWPLAPGWWMLLLVIILLTILSYFLVKHYRQGSMKRLALKSLKKIKASHKETADLTTFVRRLSILLRKVCITFYTREATAGLTGKKWLKFLDDTLDIDNKKIGMRFDSPIGVVLTNVPFQPSNTDSNTVDVERLYELCEAWIKSLPAYRTLKKTKSPK